MKGKIYTHSSTTLLCETLVFYFAVSCYVIYPLRLHNMSTIELLIRLLFHICHTRYLAFLACKSHLADFKFLINMINMYFHATVTCSWATLWKCEFLAIDGEWAECNTHLSLKALVALGCFLLMIIHGQWAERIASLLHRRYDSELYKVICIHSHHRI